MSANATTHGFDVAICGAGPVGLTAAALLAARGRSVVLVERRTHTSDEPKAISIDDESLRVYQQAGVVDEILRIVVPGTGTRYYDRNDKPLFQARGGASYRLGFPFKNPFAQPDLERALAQWLCRHPRVDVRFGTEVTGVHDHPAGVTLDTEEGPVDARYVIACDGGRSTVRTLRGLTMTGRSHAEVWLVVDTLDDPHDERYGMHHGDPERPHVIVAGLGGRCRYEFRLFDGEGEPTDTPPFELIESLVSRYRPITPEQVERAVNYRFHGLVADRWRDGNCFLAGDAAHMMPPFAGQGLNSGIRDVANLCWKIDDVLAGRLAPAVLDTYETERRPHAVATVRLSERLGRVVMTTSERMARRRDELIGAALDTADGRKFFEEMRYRPPQRYTEGLVVAGTGAGQEGVVIGQPQAFDTASHRVRRLDDILGPGWALIGVDIVDPVDWAAVQPVMSMLESTSVCVPVAETYPRLDRPAVIDVDGALLAEFDDLAGRFVLVRPDHFVAAVWFPDETDSVVREIASWTGADAR